MEFKRNCTECNKEITYETDKRLQGALKRIKEGKSHGTCTSCTSRRVYTNKVARGENVLSNKGMTFEKKKHDAYWKLCPNDDCDELIGYTTIHSLKKNPTSRCKKCARNDEEVAAKIIHSLTNPTDKARLNMRNGAIKRIEEADGNGGQMMQNYNRNSIAILEAKAAELGIEDLQHAENGGEFKVAGYFVDGYSKEHNLVIEYDEPFHYDWKGQLREKDKRREIDIKNVLNCKFIRIKE